MRGIGLTLTAVRPLAWKDLRITTVVSNISRIGSCRGWVVGCEFSTLKFLATILERIPTEYPNWSFLNNVQ